MLEDRVSVGVEHLDYSSQVPLLWIRTEPLAGHQSLRVLDEVLSPTGSRESIDLIDA